MPSSRSDAVALIRTATSPSPVLGDHFGGRQRAIIFLRCREGACKFSPQPIERFLLCTFFFAPDQLADVFSDVLVRLICIDVRRHELGRRDVGPGLRKSFCAGTVLNLCAFLVTDNKEDLLLCTFFFAPDQVADAFPDVLVRLVCIDVRRHELGRRAVGPGLRQSFCAGALLNLCAFLVTDNKEDLRMSRATSWRRAGFRHGSPVFRRAAIKMLHAVIKFPPAQRIDRFSVAQSCGCEDLAVQVSNLTPADGRPSGDVLSSSSLNACPMAVPTIVRLSTQNLSEKRA
jgi:hypothetical protein